MNGNTTKYFQGKKKWLLLQTENSPDLKEESKNSCASLGLAHVLGAGGGLSSPWEAGKSQQIGVSF